MPDNEPDKAHMDLNRSLIDLNRPPMDLIRNGQYNVAILVGFS